jgi:peptide/nickel transport system permease protein
MISYIVRRLLISALLVLIVSLLVFFLMRCLPGDPALIALGDSASQAAIDAYRNRLGLNDPVYLQYWHWITRIITHWDFGKSVLNEGDVSDLIKQRLPNTLSIGLPTLAVGVAAGIPLGILTAIKRGSWLDQALTLLLHSFLGTPRFLVAIFGVLVLALDLGLIPLQGFTPPWVNFGGYMQKAAWPVLVGSLYIVAVIARHTRSNLVEVMNQDYIRTARANGLSETRIVFGHALKNALIPVVTTIGLEIPAIVGGAVVIETVFNIPGIGQMILAGITDRDYLVVQAAVLVISIITIGSNAAVECAYALIDPRIKGAARR